MSLSMPYTQKNTIKTTSSLGLNRSNIIKLVHSLLYSLKGVSHLNDLLGTEWRKAVPQTFPKAHDIWTCLDNSHVVAWKTYKSNIIYKTYKYLGLLSIENFRQHCSLIFVGFFVFFFCLMFASSSCLHRTHSFV